MGMHRFLYSKIIKWYILCIIFFWISNAIARSIPYLNFDFFPSQSSYEYMLNNVMRLWGNIEESKKDSSFSSNNVKFYFVQLAKLYKNLKVLAREDSYSDNDLSYILHLVDCVAVSLVSSFYSRAITPESVPAIKIPEVPI